MLYHLLIYPLSLLPLWLLYGLARLSYFILRYLVGYRQEVIKQNIEIAFPQWSDKEKQELVKKTYRHLANLLVEGIKNISISKEELQQRMTLQDPELFERLFAANKSIMLISSHLENWEFFITAQQFLMPHRAFGIGKKIQKGKLNQQINSRRERFGMQVIHAQNYREVLAKEIQEKPLALLTLADQSPAPDNSYWCPFFTKETAFAFGPEFMAHEYNMAVVYLVIKKDKRGYYHAETELICEDPKEMAYGEISTAYIHRLKRDIEACPEAWLWTHKRWKHPLPFDLSQFKKEHKEKFIRRFADKV